MRKSFLTSILVLISCINYAQKCEVISDPITNEKLITVNLELKWLYIENKNGITRCDFRWWFVGAVNEIILKGSEVKFKLESGEVLSFIITQDAEPVYIQGPLMNSTEYKYVFNMDKTALEKLSLSKVILIRFPNTKITEVDMTEKSRSANKYFKAFLKGSKHILANT